MENYKLVANESYDMIGKEVDLQLMQNPETSELRFVKIKGTRLMYNAFALNGSEIPSIDGFDFTSVGRKRELGSILSSEIRESLLPTEVRVIKPNHDIDSWGIFIKFD